MSVLANLWVQSSESDEETVNSDAEIVNSTCKTNQKKTSSTVSTANNLLNSLYQILLILHLM